MAEGTIDAYNLGKNGVVVDKSLVHAEDGELSKAQNAIHDKHGSDGGICNREGLVKNHSVAAAGSILGFIGAPLGPGPGTTTDDQTTYYVANNNGTWYTSTDSFATTTAVSTLAAHKSGTLTAMLDGRLYYVSTAETVRVFDGVKDSLFFDPHSTFPTVSAIFAVNGTLYAGVVDGSSNSYVIELDPVGRGTQIGLALSNNYGISSIIYHQNDLFVGAVKAASEFRVYRIRLTPATSTTAWTQDFESSGITGATEVGMASFKGLLYVGHNSSGGSKGRVLERSTAAVYTARDTGVSNGSDVTSLRVFKDKIYAAWAEYNATPDDVIRSSSDGTTWATVHTLPIGFDAGEFYSSGNKLILVFDGDFVTPGSYSVDGVTWTNFATTGIALRETLGVFKASGTGPAFGATSSFIVLQGGTALQILNAAGTIVTLTMPTGVTLDASRPPRFAVFDRFIIVANTPSQPITVDADGIVRVLTPMPPNRAIEIDDDGGAGALTGTYKALQTFLILDEAGNIIAESDFSPVMETAFTASADTLNVEALNISPDNITASQIYRTTTGGDTYFPWITVDGNVLTQSVSDDQTDAAIGLVAAPVLGTAPRLSLVSTWRGRVWGVDRADVDHVRYTEAGQMWAWPRDNDILIGREGSDARGITAIMARRDALAFGRRDSINQVTGTNDENFRSVVLTENCGVESQETVCIYKDTAYFLWKDGVYTWDQGGIKCISDTKVRSWFVTDTYFNRARFPYSWACVDPVRNKYCLFLTAAGDSSENRWVEYDMDEGTWWGPHKTGAFTPVSAGVSYSSADRALRLVGSSNGFLWKDQTTRTDDTATAIDFDVDTKRHDGGTPKIDKVWRDMTVSLVPQTGGLLTINPSVGELDAAASSQALQAELSEASYTIGRLGLGKAAKLNFRHTVAGRLVQILGYEIDFHEAGQR